MSQLTHPNTVAVYDYGRSPDGVFYYAMEYLGGGIDLEQLVRRTARSRRRASSHILAQVCGALAGGARRAASSTATSSRRTSSCASAAACPTSRRSSTSGSSRRSPRDTARRRRSSSARRRTSRPRPSPIRATIGPAVDLYALGAVGYFLLTGRRVFDGKTAVELCIQHVTDAPHRPSEVTATDPARARGADHAVPREAARRPPGLGLRARDRPHRNLRAIGDWTRTDASAWWLERRRLADSVATASSSPTATLAIDLDQRNTSPGA